MKPIRIQRYKDPQAAHAFAGLIEGERDDGTRWILYLDENGSPCVFFPQRGPDGAVIGDPIELASAPYFRTPADPAAEQVERDRTALQKLHNAIAAIAGTATELTKDSDG